MSTHTDVQCKRIENSLLLYLETRAVDHSGKVETRRMSQDDKDVVERWVKDGYVKYGRLPFHEIQRCVSINESFASTHWVILSDKAIADAHRLRAERIARSVDLLKTLLGNDV